MFECRAAFRENLWVRFFAKRFRVARALYVVAEKGQRQKGCARSDQQTCGTDAPYPRAGPQLESGKAGGAQGIDPTEVEPGDTRVPEPEHRAPEQQIVGRDGAARRPGPADVISCGAAVQEKEHEGRALTMFSEFKDTRGAGCGAGEGEGEAGGQGAIPA